MRISRCSNSGNGWGGGLAVGGENEKGGVGLPDLDRLCQLVIMPVRSGCLSSAHLLNFREQFPGHTFQFFL